MLLRKAASFRSRDAVGCLLNAGVYLNAADAAGNTALHHAVVGDAIEVVDALLGAGADYDRKASNGTSPFFTAAYLGKHVHLQ